MATKLSYKDVVEYFDEITTEMAELVLSIIEDRLTVKIEKKAAMSARLKKARAARGSKDNTDGSHGQQSHQQHQQSAASPQSPATRRPGRPRTVDNSVTTVATDPNEALVAGQ